MKQEESTKKVLNFQSAYLVLTCCCRCQFDKNLGNHLIDDPM